MPHAGLDDIPAAADLVVRFAEPVAAKEDPPE